MCLFFISVAHPLVKPANKKIEEKKPIKKSKWNEKDINKKCAFWTE